jgi:hypothetical protein
VIVIVLVTGTVPVNIKDVFSSKYLSANDIDNEVSYPVTIVAVDTNEFGQGKDKQVKFEIKFREIKKPFIVNKTNANSIAKLLGPETDEWVGKRITLFKTEVQYKDEMVDGIRIKSKLPPPSARFPGLPNPEAPARQAAPQMPEVGPPPSDAEGDVPF